MITNNTLRNLGVVAAVLVVLSAWVGTRTPTVEFEFNKGQLLVSFVDADQVETLTVKHGADETKLRRNGPAFLVESLRGYPASMREVNGLIRSVLGIRCAAEVGSAADAHADLHVVADGDEATTVRFLNADGKELIGVVVADSKDGQQFARLVSSDTVYRTEEFVSLRSKPMDFVDKQLLQLKREDIAKVEVAPKDGTTYLIDSPEAGKVELKGIPQGKKAKGSEPDSVFGATTYLNFDDFKSEQDLADLEFSHRYTVTTRSKAVYAFELAKKDDKWWVRASAEYAGPKLTVPNLPANATEEQKKANEEILKRNVEYGEAIQATQKFAEQHQSWIYQLSSWKAEAMTKAFDQLVQDDDGRPEKITASHILIPYQGAQNAAADVTRTKEEAKALAEEVLAKVKADPSKFGELAMEYSSCPSKDKGGDLGEFPFEQMSKPFSEAAFKLKVGELSDVVETEFGYHVIERTK